MIRRISGRTASPGVVVKQDPALAALQQGLHRRCFRERVKDLIKEDLGKLDHLGSSGHGFGVADIADPVLRQVRSSHDQLPGRKLAYMVADVKFAMRGHHEMNLILGMVMPPHRTERISVPPGGKGLTISDMDQLKVELHFFLPFHRGRCASSRRRPSFRR
jgi:hypothetical protein